MSIIDYIAVLMPVATIVYVSLLPRIMLWRVNRVRTVLGKDKLKRLLRGEQGNIDRCPIAASIGGCSVDVDKLRFFRPMTSDRQKRVERAWKPLWPGLGVCLSNLLFIPLFDKTPLYRGYRKR